MSNKERKVAAISNLAANRLPLAISVEEAAELLGIGRATAYEAVKLGQIAALRFGGHDGKGGRIVIPVAPLLELLSAYEESGVVEDSNEKETV